MQRRAQLTRLRLRSLEKIELLHEIKGELFEPKKFEQFFFDRKQQVTRKNGAP